MKLITVNDDLFVVCGTVLVEKVIVSTEELKSQYRLADTVLRNGDSYYICQKIDDAEFEHIS
jgi:hypothetical protein|tara:strand:- start:149 stop:334 length:186 start_codon:yes stop_codon:yes gene_type:complete